MTCILGNVSVPVLSVHSIFAPPIVSHAARWRTKLPLCNIRRILYANEMVTDSGKPYGTATTTMAIAVVKFSKNFIR